MPAVGYAAIPEWLWRDYRQSRQILHSTIYPCLISVCHMPMSCTWSLRIQGPFNCPETSIPLHEMALCPIQSERDCPGTAQIHCMPLIDIVYVAYTISSVMGMSCKCFVARRDETTSIFAADLRPAAEVRLKSRHLVH